MSKKSNVESTEIAGSNNNKFVFEVQIDILPAMQFEADHAQDAIDQYYKFFGIISTEDRINVRKVN